MRRIFRRACDVIVLYIKEENYALNVQPETRPRLGSPPCLGSRPHSRTTDRSGAVIGFLLGGATT
jgi:hypothetical protein